MQTTNDHMTEEQLADLANLASQLQAKAEASDDRDTAVMAYAVQRACAELTESRREFRAADATIRNLEQQLAAVVAENAGLRDFVKACFRAAADGASLDGADIQELGERLGLFGRETYQPALHGYICGHEAGEDTVYVMNKTPATDAAIANIQAQGVEMFAQTFNSGTVEGSSMKISAIEFAAQLRQGAK